MKQKRLQAPDAVAQIPSFRSYFLSQTVKLWSFNILQPSRFCIQQLYAYFKPMNAAEALINKFIDCRELLEALSRLCRMLLVEYLTAYDG